MNQGTLLRLGQLSRQFEDPITNRTMRDGGKFWKVGCEHFTERFYIEEVRVGTHFFQDTDNIAQDNLIHMAAIRNSKIRIP